MNDRKGKALSLFSGPVKKIADTSVEKTDESPFKLPLSYGFFLNKDRAQMEFEEKEFEIIVECKISTCSDYRGKNFTGNYVCTSPTDILTVAKHITSLLFETQDNYCQGHVYNNCGELKPNDFMQMAKTMYSLFDKLQTKDNKEVPTISKNELFKIIEAVFNARNHPQISFHAVIREHALGDKFLINYQALPDFVQALMTYQPVKFKKNNNYKKNK